MDVTTDAAKGGEGECVRQPCTSTWAGLACYFLGSIFFISGSLGFLLSTTTYVENWLWPFQFGALCWILGSLAYMAQLVPSVADTLRRSDKGPATLPDAPLHPWWLGPTGTFFCLLSFVAGCSLVFFGPSGGVADEAHVVRNLPAMNGLFTVGSAVLLVNPLYLVVVSRQWHVFPCSTSSLARHDAAAAVSPVDWWFDVVVAATFTYAGAAGGYGTGQGEITSGMVLWLVGSLILLVQAVSILAAKLSSVDSERTVTSKLAVDTDECFRGAAAKERDRDCPV